MVKKPLGGRLQSFQIWIEVMKDNVTNLILQSKYTETFTIYVEKGFYPE